VESGVRAIDKDIWLQATLYKMASDIIKKNPSVGSVSYKLPNKHYIRAFRCISTPHTLLRSSAIPAVDLSYMKLSNTTPEDAEVFCPVAAPR
jgi:urate oxidase